MAIRLAIDTIPPFLMAGSRFTIAGSIFLIWCYWRFDNRPSIKDWGQAAIPGLLLFVFGNGSLTWAEQYIPSGLAALIIATLSLWMVLLEWLIYKGKRPDIFTNLWEASGVEVSNFENRNESLILKLTCVF